MRRETWLTKKIWLLWKSRTTLWPMQTAMCWLTSPASLRCWLESTFPLWRVKTHLYREDFDFFFLFSSVTVCVDIWTTLTDILLPLEPPVCWVSVRVQINHSDLDNICLWLSVQGSWLDPTALEICVMPRSQFPLEPLQPSPPPPLFVSFFTAPCRRIANNAHQSQICFGFLCNLSSENTCLLSFLWILKPINLWPHWSWVPIYWNNCKLSCQLGHDKRPFLKQITCGIVQCLMWRWFVFPESSKNIFTTSLELRPCLHWSPMISKKEQWRWHSTAANIESRYTAVSLDL